MLKTACHKNRLTGAMLIACLFLGACSAWGSESTLKYGRFGKLTLYQTSAQPNHVVLFVSGDGGWNLGVIDMARSLAGLDALVVGIDITHYLRQLRRSSENCSYPAADFENLSKFIQMKLGFEHYQTPVLVGYSSGATLVYALLAQAPPNTFRGAISLGFCPDLPLNKPFCAGHSLTSKPDPANHGYDFLPTSELKNPWIVFQGTIDQVCNAGAVETFVKGVNNAETILLPRVGHGFSVQKNWLPQFRAAFTRLIASDKSGKATDQPASVVTDLPLIELPANGPASNLLAIILSGDGGWASIDRDIGTTLAARGIPVVGLNTLRYFWTPSSPEQSARDLERILRHYMSAWKRERVVLIGFSLGADVLPFMASRLPDKLQSRIATVALLNPGKTASFEFHLSDWMGGGGPPGRPIAPELARLQGLNVLCVYGRNEKDSLCRDLKPDRLTKSVGLDGGHHFDGDYKKLVELILAEVDTK
ncbi:AcvB/VirJ family lysyl-phosphatidylglycerol hydrolase [Geopsychrobacter electrodiphilus]|uniref:AcvB/VirJ family lysyl-phosphatidylglycerol hydrolase n=1 Tax=Geopsychrobacter electrodiphilus TaxID=225196 RepID=UPI00036CE6C7|nr:AcvB/VirJ family lysyl-phosphatidylglycerol hydrolase [Geopsychrobacter electrodiphilus]